MKEDELSRLREACSIKGRSALRDKAIIETLYETAFRPHEFLSLRKNMIISDDYGALVHVPGGKTGPRRIRVMNAAPLLANWLENHPLKAKDSAIWVDLSMNRKFEPLAWYGLDRLVKRLAGRANIEKNVNAYTFRRTRLTNLANFMTEAQLCEFAGWEQGSDMPRMYIHLTGRDVDEALLKAHRLIKPEEVELPKPRRRVRCAAINYPNGETRNKCGMVLTMTAAMKKDDEMKKMQNDIEELKGILRNLKPVVE